MSTNNKINACTVLSAAGYKYAGPHKFASPAAALQHLRTVFNDPQIAFDTDPNEEDAASVEVRTPLCGNSVLVATLILD